MRVYNVIPIAKAIGKETLTYFGGNDIPHGALVSIPLRKNTANALVISSKPITEDKATLKSSRFALKKVGKVKQKKFLSREFLEAAQKTADFYGTSVGSILSSVLPKLVLERKAVEETKTKESLPNQKPEILVLQESDSERFAHYKGFIRGEFARNSSVFVCVPTKEDLFRIKKTLEKGIEKYTAILHRNMSKKDFALAEKMIRSEKHPVLIIGTPAFLSLERSDLKSIIVEKENSRAYRLQTRPYLDLRVFVKNLAYERRNKLILGDLMLSLETLWHRESEEYAEFFPVKSRLLSPAEHLLVDMKLGRDEKEEKFRVLSPELESLCDKTIADSEHLFIFCARKGLSPLTVCGDCSKVLLCSRCKAPITLYAKAKENIFICNRCGNEESTLARCENCGSWKLETLGIGIELVEKEIKKLFPKAVVLRMDKESVKTEKETLRLMEKFESTPGAILVGTEMGLLYLRNPIENMAVATIDPLFALPDFRINEKIFGILLNMRERAEKVFIIQTRNGVETIFDYALKGNLLDFYRDEIEERKKFNYPPFSQFIKLTLEGKRAGVLAEAEKLKEYLEEWKPTVLESGNLSRRGNTLVNIIFRFDTKDWPTESFVEKIRSLPAYVAVSVDPENLLS